ncbi:MAG: glycosyltransferase family 39 protein [Anaerolineales bacterium]|nr:glycosyltransferase family 39 protein [Anaerolineales bacterium]
MISKPSPLPKRLLPGLTVAPLLVILLMLTSLALHLANLDALGNANAYYTAAVKSMLQSWHNFFYVAAEPGGSVTVDKPPLGLWIEAAFAFVLGVSGFTVSLPNILAGVFSIPLLYTMVKKYMGALAGLLAALVMTFTPIFVATNRNNTMDGLLVFFLLLAAWAFIRATETGKARWVMLGAFIVGLGFNIKMLQAFLPLPAFYILYFFGSKEGWLRKIINLGLATLLLVIVSLSWAVAVDLVPADQRPFIGSSGDNTVMGLILGHNGTERLFGGFGNRAATAPSDGNQPNQNPASGQNTPGGFNGPQPDNTPFNPPSGNPPQQAFDACTGQTLGESCTFDLPRQTITGSCISAPNQTQLVCAPQGQTTQQLLPPNGPDGGPNDNGPSAPNDGGGTPFSQETGSPGIFRFFVAPLSKQMSWLLPFALLSLLALAFAGKVRFPLESGAHKGLLLWGGWLMTCLVFLSAVSGIFHAYYTIMLAPALGAVVGMGVAQLWRWGQEHVWAGIVFGAATLATLIFQALALTQYGVGNGTLLIPGILFVTGLILFPKMRRTAYITLCAAMLVIPIYWTAQTVFNPANNALPTAYKGPTADPRTRPNGPANGNDYALLTYLEASTASMKYLVAVPSSQVGATMVIATGRPVLYMGGFSGGDAVVSADDLAALVANGDLRFVYYGGGGNPNGIANWLQTSCTVVPEFTRMGQQGGQNGPGNQTLTLYDCAP